MQLAKLAKGNQSAASLIVMQCKVKTERDYQPTLFWWFQRKVKKEKKEKEKKENEEAYRVEVTAMFCACCHNCGKRAE
jgi:hypothetical protein